MLKQARSLTRRIGRGRMFALVAVLALVTGFVATELAEAKVVGGLCRICRVTDPCTGTVYTASGCCALPKRPKCLVAATAAGCIGGVTVVCR